jgi:hypothetical protein
MPLDDELTRLYAATGFRRNPLWKTWAKLELVLGLVAAAGGLVAITDGSDTTITAAGIGLFVLGFYLALAGHRSHLYQSNNQLAAYLAELIRSRTSGSNT